MRDAPAKSEARLLVVDDKPTILELLLRGACLPGSCPWLKAAGRAGRTGEGRGGAPGGGPRAEW